MKYVSRSFSVAMGSDAYLENWDRVFGKRARAAQADVEQQAADEVVRLRLHRLREQDDEALLVEVPES